VSDEGVLKSRVVRSRTPKMPKILFQSAEEIFPALKESTVSVVWHWEMAYQHSIGVCN